ncbi:MAG: sensor histidine kinase [Propionibacteriaceae bacterium]
MTDGTERAHRPSEPQQLGVLWPTPDPPRELRGLNLAALAMTGLPALALVFLDGVSNPGTVGAVGVILVSLVLSIFLVRYWRRSLPRTTMVVLLVLAAAALITAYVLAQNPMTVLATSAPFGFGVAWFRPRWLPAVVGLGAIALAALVSSRVHAEHVGGNEIVFMCIFFGAAVIGFGGTSVDWQVKRRMDRHHADQNELSLARERLRFATDLHDIQGHTLLAIKMKAELARRSMERDPERALRELRDIEDLAAQAGDQTRELAQGYRSLTLAAEVANLDQLLSAAGIRVRIDRHGEHAPEHEELFAALVREAASNILRHADAEQVRITLAPTTVSIRNDGARTTGEPRADVQGRGLGGSGMAGLERRFQRDGGAFTWQHEGEHFTVTGTIGEQP